MRVGILGSGLMGAKLGTIFRSSGTRSGLQLCPQRAETQAACTRGRRRGASRHTARGDDRRGKEAAAGLIRDVGFDPVDAGPLRIARYTEPFTMLIAQLAYEGAGGPELAYRFERFKK